MSADWYPCRVCKMRHPWPLEERPCPNEAIVARTGLTGLAALKASGLFDRFEKPAAPAKLVVVDTPVDGVDQTPVHEVAVNSVNTAGVNSVNTVAGDNLAERKAYRREWMRRHRAAERAMKAASEGAPPC